MHPPSFHHRPSFLKYWIAFQHSETQTYALHTYQLIKPHPLQELSYPTNFTARLRNAAPSPEPGTPLMSPRDEGGNPLIPAFSSLLGQLSRALAALGTEMLLQQGVLKCSGRHKIKPFLLSEPW